MTDHPGQWFVIAFLLMTFVDVVNRDGWAEAIKMFVIGLPVLLLIITALLALFGYEHLPAEFILWMAEAL